MNEPLPVVVLADMLCASADDVHVLLARRDANRLAERTIELLAVAGYHFERAPTCEN